MDAGKVPLPHLRMKGAQAADFLGCFCGWLGQLLGLFSQNELVLAGDPKPVRDPLVDDDDLVRSLEQLVAIQHVSDGVVGNRVRRRVHG